MQAAFQDRDGEGQWFLDGQTGEVIRLDEFDDEQRERIHEAAGERYIAVPYQGSEPAHRDMAEFTQSVNDHRLRALLDVAIRGKGAFHRFKEVLREDPEERARWFVFQKERTHSRILRWLDSEDIEPVAARPSDN